MSVYYSSGVRNTDPHCFKPILIKFLCLIPQIVTMLDKYKTIHFKPIFLNYYFQSPQKILFLSQEDGTTLNVIKKGAIDFIGLPKPTRKVVQSPQMNVVQAHQVS